MSSGFSISFLMILLPLVAIAIAAVLATALRHQDHAKLTDGRICRSCGQSHPPFAQFCRRCGKKL
jgi:ribosomal protein L40E